MDHLVLVIDDQLPNLIVAEVTLQAAGYGVIKAGSAKEAQDALDGFVPDVVLVDLAMPGMNGLEFTRWFKAQPRLREIPVLAVTAHAMTGDEASARDAGCTGYLTKPFVLTELVDAVARAIEEFGVPKLATNEADDLRTYEGRSSIDRRGG